jgi:L-serine deaminase
LDIIKERPVWAFLYAQEKNKLTSATAAVPTALFAGSAGFCPIVLEVLWAHLSALAAICIA